jgi:hypothetical protein
MAAYPYPPTPNPKYCIGDILVQSIYEPNSIPWFKDQMYTIKKYDPLKQEFMIVGTADNYPRFYTQVQLDITFTIRRRGR